MDHARIVPSDPTTTVARRLALCLLSLALAACGDSSDGSADGGGADGALDGAVTCTDDSDCDDGLFCNGTETCDPSASGGQCAAGDSPCLAGMTCDEDADTCRTECAADPDADGDGHDAMDCGGDDCDDTDANRYPGNAEVCDTDGHDEDCDPTTFGSRDLDGDGVVDAVCCNTSDSGDTTCGADCDDSRRNVHPSATEACDRFDNDCDGTIDEDVQADLYVDADRDGHGDPSMPMMACADTFGLSPIGDDCDDTNPARHPAQVEFCDGVDNDCNGTVDDDTTDVTWFEDADGDGFGSPSGATMVSCSPVSGYSLLATDCDDDNAAVHPAAAELCDGIDNNCSGVADFAVGPGDFEDDDGDGYVDSACTPAGDDCDDGDPTTYPGAMELCDGRDNDCDGMVDEGTSEVPWYVDTDGDGYGNDYDDPVTSCVPVAGRVLRAGDCDDDDPTVNPAARDYCGGGDEDCDGDVDEDGASGVFYTDIDEDGWGVGGPMVITDCSAVGTGLATRAGDCDDFDPARNPGLVEACNGIDDDCDATVDEEPAASASCAAPHATASCASAACEITACDDGYSDCNGDPSDGCEAELATDVLNCGACGTSCGVGNDCTAGECSTSAITGVAAGLRHACALRANGRVLCWGSDVTGELGDGAPSGYGVSTKPANIPVLVSGLSDATQIDAGGGAGGDGGGGGTTCAVRSGGGVSCWGNNDTGQLGIGTGGWGESRDTPVAVSGITDATQVSVGSIHVCALRSTGGVLCWGMNNSGQLGDGTTTVRATPRAVTGLSDATQVSAGGSHTCALRTGGTVVCWGSNSWGQLGDGTDTDRSTPVTVSGITTAVEVSAGDRHSCARLASGEVRCWGIDWYGQLGDGDTSSTGEPPVLVTGLTDAAELAAGENHGCAVRTDGTAVCWGRTIALGAGEPSSPTAPVAVVGLESLEAVDAGKDFTCALGAGTVWCWGINYDGQTGVPYDLGDGSGLPAILEGAEYPTHTQTDWACPYVPMEPYSPLPACSTATADCVGACADSACSNACVDADPDCRSCVNQNTWSCRANDSCQAPWWSYRCCAVTRCPSGDPACGSAMCDEELAILDQCFSDSRDAGRCTSAWIECFP